jgi:hypothetical protein
VRGPLAWTSIAIGEPSAPHGPGGFAAAELKQTE